MFEHFTTADEVFSFKLGSALAMEHDSLEMLGDMEQTAMRSEVKDLFRDHARETRQQIENLDNCFAALGFERHQEPSPTMKGLAKETESFIAKTDNALVDAVVLAGALETEHHETAVYESLIAQAKALGATEAAELLNQNLLQEQAAIAKIKALIEVIARANAEVRHAETGEEPLFEPDPALGLPPYLPPGSI